MDAGDRAGVLASVPEVDVDKAVVVISIRTRPGRRTALRELWDQHLRPRVEASQAQEAYLVVEDSAQPDVLHLIEVYNDPRQMQRNAAAPWFADYLAEASPLMDGAPATFTGTPVWTKGVPV
jgi:quinol monooxygenase YgiN